MARIPFVMKPRRRQHRWKQPSDGRQVFDGGAFDDRRAELEAQWLYPSDDVDSCVAERARLHVGRTPQLDLDAVFTRLAGRVPGCRRGPGCACGDLVSLVALHHEPDCAALILDLLQLEVGQVGRQFDRVIDVHHVGIELKFNRRDFADHMILL